MTNKIGRRNCPICGSSRKRLLFQQHFSKMSAGSLLDGYDVVVCQDCGFGFADNLPDQTAFDAYYREMSKYEHQERGGQQTEFENRRFPATAEIIKLLLPDHQARILDIGCATGGLLHTLSQNGYRNVLGIDPSPVCARTASDLYQIKVLTGTLSDITDDIGIFDLIILAAVLEHLQHLESALSRAKGLLSDRGMLYIEVPDAAHFICSDRDAPFQEFSIEHINYFSVASLSNLIQSYGFYKIFSQQTSIEQSTGIIAHDIKAMFQRADHVQSLTLVHDTETEQNLRAYISKSQEIENRIIRKIDSLVTDGKPIIVWGVGTLTQRLSAVSKLAKANIQVYVDSNPRYQGRQIDQIPIIAPAELKGRTEPILISSIIFQEEIKRQIRNDLKLTNKIIKLS